MKNVYSTAYLYRFLRLVAKQQRLPTSTLQAWRAAAHALLPAGTNCDDLRQYDLDAAVQRYVDRQLLQYTSILPWQLHQHRNAFEGMLSDFVVFSARPKQYLAALSAMQTERAVGSSMQGGSGTVERRESFPAYRTTFQDILQSLPRPRRVKVISPLTACNDECLF